MFSLKHLSRTVIGVASGLFLLVSHGAVNISQTPLLTQSAAVTPNLMLILDDSGSMNAQYIYQYGGSPSGYGMTGPGVSGKRASCPSTTTIDITCTYNAPSVSVGVAKLPDPWVAQSYDFGDYVTRGGNTYMCNRDAGCNSGNVPGSSGRWVQRTPPGPGGAFYELSPDVNRISYDPRVLYGPRLTGVGTATTAAATPSTADFYVFFYKNASGNSMVWPGTGNDPTLFTSYFKVVRGKLHHNPVLGEDSDVVLAHLAEM